MGSANQFLFLFIIFIRGCFSENTTHEYPEMSVRVFGGREAVVGEVPHIVSLRRNNFHMCGGCIISDKWILTAAHCVYNMNRLSIAAGLLRLKRPEQSGQFINVDKVVIHPLYTDSNLDGAHDIALLKLEKKLVFNDFVQPIEIMAENEMQRAITDRTPAFISGWGVNEESLISKFLKIAKINLISNNECEEMLPPCENINFESFICGDNMAFPTNMAGDYDDGGPLTVNEKLAGIIHGVYHSCPDRAIFTNLVPYYDFINEHTGIGPQRSACNIDDIPLATIEITFEDNNSNKQGDLLSQSIIVSYRVIPFQQEQDYAYSKDHSREHVPHSKNLPFNQRMGTDSIRRPKLIITIATYLAQDDDDLVPHFLPTILRSLRFKASGKYVYSD